MGHVVPIDDFVTEEWYPGFPPADGDMPWVVEPFRPFRAGDEGRFWFLDFHWPRGLTPLGLVFLADTYAWGSQHAAESLPLPPGRGISPRLAGTHIYASPIDVTSSHERAARIARVARKLPDFLEHFPDIWAGRLEELTTSLSYFEQTDMSTLDRATLATRLREARVFGRRAWEIHFELMYPLLVQYLAFRGLCEDLGLDPAHVAVFCQGDDTKIMETDRELWRLTGDARRLGLDATFAETPPEDLVGTLRAAGGGASIWLSHFHEFLDGYGWRTEGIADVALASWIEDPTPPLGMIRSFLQRSDLFDFEAAHRLAIAQRDDAVDDARSRLTRAELVVFDEALAATRHANFAWWNDEHNVYIDLRAALPLRRVALAIGAAAGADSPDDTVFLGWSELCAVADGSRTWASVRSLIGERRDFYETWRTRRPSMPKVLGLIPERVLDPVLIEVFGMHHHFFAAISDGGDGNRLVGLGASGGVARGQARVLFDATDLHRMLPGEVLVCESTSPNWTPAFGKIAACVCDNGGSLSHAAIVSREYHVPCVVGVGAATGWLHTGDEVEVDGTRGVVRVLRRTGTGDAGP